MKSSQSTPHDQIGSTARYAVRSFHRKLAAVIYSVFVVGLMVSPVMSGHASAAPCTLDKQVLGIPTWYKYLRGDDSSGTCLPILRVDDVPQGQVSEKNINSALPIALAILEIAITLAGIIAFIMVIWGSVKFMLALGEPDKFAAGRKTVQNAMIGLVIILVASRVVSFIGGRLVQ